MLKILIICIVGFIPPLLSVWSRRRAEARIRSRLRTAMEAAVEQEWRSLERRFDEQTSAKNRSLMGDPSCQFNARSLYIRCAVNPLGPCENCPHYQTQSETAG